jgi:hypothetical protein
MAIAPTRQQAAIDPIKVARKLWKNTRVKEGRLEPNRVLQGADQGGTLKSNEPGRPAPA